MQNTLDIGAIPVDGEVLFRVWAPFVTSVEVELVDSGAQKIPLRQDGEYFQGLVPAAPGDRYWYWLDGAVRRSDPASRSQPDGVHGPSRVIDPTFDWGDRQWRGIALEGYVIYELHVGTFTPQGTFDGVISRLDYLVDLGITAVELMPVAQFPGERNWGYDGVYPFAPQSSYGGPDGLKRLVDACHFRGLAVILDVVYNHLGPEGNYLHSFGPYFTDHYRTPWGDAVNFDGPGSDQVRHYFISNALYWITEYHIDALRLDAIHGIYDFSALHILQELSEAVHRRGDALGRRVHVIAESDLNDVRVINPIESGGYGLDAQWNDDFHHALHVLLTGETDRYYQDFGSLSDLAKAIREGYVYSGRYSDYRKRRHGSSSKERPARQFVLFSQNHDQTGNRMMGERLAGLVSFDSLKLAAGAVLLSPGIPLLFMGEEYGETAPFIYFIDHSDQLLVDQVREGRKKAFKACGGDPPDPAAEETFVRSKLAWESGREGQGNTLHTFYRTLIALRMGTPVLGVTDKKSIDVRTLEEQRLLFMERWNDEEHFLCLLSFNDEEICFVFPAPTGSWRKILDSSDTCWSGPGSTLPALLVGAGSEIVMRAKSFAVYRKEC